MRFAIIVLGILASSHLLADETRMDQLERTVNDHEVRISKLETSAPSVEWSCAAQCGYIRNRNVYSLNVTGLGRTAAHAMDHMRANCDKNVRRAVLFQRIDRGPNRSITLVPVTLRDNCLRNL